MSTGRLDLGNAGEEGGGREEDLRLEEEESVGADQDVAVGVDFEEISVQSIEPETSAAAKKKRKEKSYLQDGTRTWAIIYRFVRAY